MKALLTYYKTQKLNYRSEWVNKYIHNQHIILDVSLDSRPIKIRPGTYCMGDSAHALQITQIWIIILRT